MEVVPRPAELPDKINPDPGLAILSDEELDRYCADAGLTFLRSKTVKAFKKVGEHLDSLGVIHVSTTKVIETGERIQKLADRCDEIIDTTEDPEVKVDAIRAARELMSEQLRAQELIVKMAERKLVKDPHDKPRARGPAIGQQVYINTAGDVTVREPKDFAPEEPVQE